MDPETLRTIGVVFAAVLLNWRMLTAHRDHTEKWVASLSKRIDDLQDKSQ